MTFIKSNILQTNSQRLLPPRNSYIIDNLVAGQMFKFKVTANFEDRGRKSVSSKYVHARTLDGGWMDKPNYGWMDRYMDGWMDRWMNGLTNGQ